MQLGSRITMRKIKPYKDSQTRVLSQKSARNCWGLRVHHLLTELTEAGMYFKAPAAFPQGPSSCPVQYHVVRIHRMASVNIHQILRTSTHHNHDVPLGPQLHQITRFAYRGFISHSPNQPLPPRNIHKQIQRIRCPTTQLIYHPLQFHRFTTRHFGYHLLEC